MSKPRKIGKSPLKKACSPKEVEVLESLGDIKYDDDSYDESPVFRIPRTQSKLSEASPMTPREVFEAQRGFPVEAFVPGAISSSLDWTEVTRRTTYDSNGFDDYCICNTFIPGKDFKIKFSSSEFSTSDSIDGH